MRPEPTAVPERRRETSSDPETALVPIAVAESCSVAATAGLSTTVQAAQRVVDATPTVAFSVPVALPVTTLSARAARLELPEVLSRSVTPLPNVIESLLFAVTIRSAHRLTPVTDTLGKVITFDPEFVTYRRQS